MDEPQQAIISIESAAPSRNESPIETDSNNEGVIKNHPLRIKQCIMHL